MMTKINEMLKPDYDGGNIVNLMASIQNAIGQSDSDYCPLLQLQPECLQRTENIVLMVIDALGYNYIRSVGRGGSFDTYLRGSMSTVYLSTTTTAITSYLTGVAPQQHALMGWNTWLKELGAVVKVLPFRTRGGSLALEHSQIDLKSLYALEPFVNKLRVKSTFVSPDMIIDSAYNCAQQGRAQTVPHYDLESFFAQTEKLIHTAQEPQYIYAYWPMLDTLGHIHGIHSQNSIEHFQELDRGFAAFLEKIQGTNTTVIVTGDHGMIDSTPESSLSLNDHPRLSETLAIPLCGEPRAVFCYVRPFKQKQFEDYVYSELADVVELMPSEQLLEEHYFGLGEVNAKLLERIGDYTLMMKDNNVLYDQLFQEHRHRHIGVHGGLSADEMLVPLVFAEV